MHTCYQQKYLLQILLFSSYLVSYNVGFVIVTLGYVLKAPRFTFPADIVLVGSICKKYFKLIAKNAKCHFHNPAHQFAVELSTMNRTCPKYFSITCDLCTKIKILIFYMCQLHRKHLRGKTLRILFSSTDILLAETTAVCNLEIFPRICLFQ